MTLTPKIGFICGSTRQGSINQQLKKELIKRAKAQGARTTDIDLGSFDLPLFHGDLDRPKALKKLTAKIKGCDGIVVVSPEYNGGLPPLLKNAIDWISTADSQAFTRPVYGIASCTPGPMSGIMCMRQLNYILMRVGAHVVPAQVGTGMANQAFDANGVLVSQPSADLADKMLDQMITWIHQKAS